MKIEEICLHQVKLPLAVPYRVSQKVFHEFMPLIIEARSEGEVGWGEALISTGYSKETPDGGWEFCREMAAATAGRDNTVARETIGLRAAESPNAASALLAALDMLEHDPLLDISDECRVPLLAPCQAHEPQAIRDEVEKLLAQGFRTLKIKVGFDVAADLERVAVIQDAVRERATLRLDANRAFSREQGCAFASRLGPRGIELFEQPCGSAAWDDNAAVARVSTVPVMLDESIYGMADIERASRVQGVGFVKLKLKKIGSVQMLKTALERIRALGMTPVLGDGVSVEIGCWMEACVARHTIDNAGEMNGYLKPTARLFENPLPFDNGDIVLTPGYHPQIDRRILDAHSMRRERFSA